MEWDWHGATLFNLRSPSSRPDLVKRIVDEFVVPKGPSARILDVGGTRQGFVAHLPEEHRPLRGRTYLLNPRGGAEIAFRDIGSVPADTEPFDLAMMFGVMVYLDERRLIETFRGIHRFLRPGGALIISDPNGSKCMNHLERPIKPLFGLPSSMYTEAETIRLLRSVGFVRCRRRRDLSGSWRYLTMVAYKAPEAGRPLNGTRRHALDASGIDASEAGAPADGMPGVHAPGSGAPGSGVPGSGASEGLRP